MQCKYRFPYQQIVYDHYLCLDCYAWARGAMDRNEGRPLLEHEVDILLATYEGLAPWGFWKMLDSREANYILDHESAHRPPMHTCTICHRYYRERDAGSHNVCKWCSNKMKKLITHQALPKQERHFISE
jgi:hypothetical protein